MSEALNEEKKEKQGQEEEKGGRIEMSGWRHVLSAIATPAFRLEYSSAFLDGPEGKATQSLVAIYFSESK